MLPTLIKGGKRRCKVKKESIGLFFEQLCRLRESKVGKIDEK